MNTEMLGEITRGCRLLESLHLESCYRLEETIFEYIKDLPVLRQLLLRDYRQGFGKLSLLERNSCLTDLDLEGSMIIDEEAIFLLKFKALKALSCKSTYPSMKIANCSQTYSLAPSFSLYKRLL